MRGRDPSRAQGGSWLAPLRRLEPPDLPRTAAIEKEAYRSTGLSTFSLRQLLEVGKRVSFAAVVDAEIVGDVLSATVSVDPREAWVLDLAVEEELRNCGMGRSLVEGSTNGLASRGARRVSLTVKPDHTFARALHLSLGFRLSKHEPCYFGPENPRDVLVKDLAPAGASQ